MVIHLGETLSCWISTFMDFHSRRVADRGVASCCVLPYGSVFGVGIEDGLYRDSEALAKVKEPATSDVTYKNYPSVCEEK